MMPDIELYPVEALVDEEVHIVVRGLDARQNITAYASLNGDEDDVFHSYAHYTANDEGTVDFFKHSSNGGSYTGVEPMGLFWGMKPSTKNPRPHSRYVKRDVETPVEVNLSVYDSYLRQDDVSIGRLLVKRIVNRWYKDRSVHRVSVREGRLRGTLFIPSGEGPFPAVVDLFGTAGGLMEFRASLLASRGIMALSLAFFAFEDLPRTAFHAELEYFEEAKEFLERHPMALKTAIGIIGVSAGGTLALAAATYVPGFRCAVCINAPIFAQYTTILYKDRVWEGMSQNMNRARVEDGALVISGILDDHWDDDIGNSEIEFYKSSNSFLFIFCEDDKSINAGRTVGLARKLLRGSGCKHKILTYPGAGHLLEPPYSPHAEVTHTKLINMPQRWGGNTKQHADAQFYAWQETLNFLRKNLIPNPNL